MARQLSGMITRNRNGNRGIAQRAVAGALGAPQPGYGGKSYQPNYSNMPGGQGPTPVDTSVQIPPPPTGGGAQIGSELGSQMSTLPPAASNTMPQGPLNAQGRPIPQRRLERAQAAGFQNPQQQRAYNQQQRQMPQANIQAPRPPWQQQDPIQQAAGGGYRGPGYPYK